MAEKAESRDKIKDGIDKRKRETDDRAKHMGLVVDDKKNVADTSRKLRLATTSEGAEAVKSAIKDAAKATDQEFGKQNQVLDKKLTDCTKAEEDLRRRTDSADKDAGDAKATAGRIKETNDAKKTLAKAEGAAKDDAKFTKNEQTRQKNERTKSEKRREQQKKQITGTKLKW